MRGLIAPAGEDLNETQAVGSASIDFNDVPLDELCLVKSPGKLLITAGGFGQLVGSSSLAISAHLGSMIEVFVFDNDEAAAPAQPLPDGRSLQFPRDRSLCIKSDVPRRTLVLRNPTLKARYVESRLLDGLPVGFADAKAGHGGGGWPLNSLIDFEIAIGDVRRHVQRALRAAAQSITGNGADAFDRAGGAFGAPAEMFILIAGGACGSFGSGTLSLLPYVIRDEAEKLGMPRPEIWALIAGPDGFRNLTSHTELSYGTTMHTLAHLSRVGLETGWQFADGSVIDPLGDAPYERVVLVDQPWRAETGADEKPTDVEQQLFAQRTALIAHLLTEAPVRNALLRELANRPADLLFPGLTTLSLGIGGVPTEHLSNLLETDVAINHIRVLLEMATAA